MLTSPANPAAILVMLAGGEGTVEITDSVNHDRRADQLKISAAARRPDAGTG